MSSAAAALGASAASWDMRQSALPDYEWMGSCHILLCFFHLARVRMHRLTFTRSQLSHNHDYRESNDACYSDHHTMHRRVRFRGMWLLLIAYVAAVIPCEGQASAMDAWPALLLACALEGNTVLFYATALLCVILSGVPVSLAGVVRCLATCVALNVQPLLSRISRACVHLSVGLMYVCMPSTGRIGIPATGVACFMSDVAGCRPALMMLLVVIGMLCQ